VPYDTDYNPQDWVISLSELLRVIQFYNSLGYHYCPGQGTEDDFCPGSTPSGEGEGEGEGEVQAQILVSVEPVEGGVVQLDPDPSLDGTYPVGAEVNLHVEAATGYVIENVSFAPPFPTGHSPTSCEIALILAALSGQEYAELNCTLTADVFREVNVSFVPVLSVNVTGNGFVESTTPGIDCPDDCMERLESGSQLVMTATPANGATFLGWSGACAGAGDCVIDGGLTEPKFVGAEFTEGDNSFNLTVNFIGNGSGTVELDPTGEICTATCTNELPSDAATTLNFIASSGSYIKSYTGHSPTEMSPLETSIILNSLGGGDPTSIVTGTDAIDMNQSYEVTIEFSEIDSIPKVDLAISGSGFVTSNPNVLDCPDDCFEIIGFEPVTLTAHPANGAAFLGWSGACTGVSECVLDSSNAQDVTASFSDGVSYDLSINMIGEGSVAIDTIGETCVASCGNEVPIGASTNLAITAATGFYIKGYSGRSGSSISPLETQLILIQLSGGDPTSITSGSDSFTMNREELITVEFASIE
jgi:hypothetical protein